MCTCNVKDSHLNGSNAQSISLLPLQRHHTTRSRCFIMLWIIEHRGRGQMIIYDVTRCWSYIYAKFAIWWASLKTLLYITQRLVQYFVWFRYFWKVFRRYDRVIISALTRHLCTRVYDSNTSSKLNSTLETNKKVFTVESTQRNTRADSLYPSSVRTRRSVIQTQDWLIGVHFDIDDSCWRLNDLQVLNVV